MIIQDVSFNTPQENVLYDEVLLHLAQREQHDEALRFWESPVPFIVLGRISKIDEDLNIPEIQKDRIMVTRRSSGGGTVVQGVGCLNYALILSRHRHPPLNDLHQSYAYILRHVIRAFEGLGVALRYLPISDLVLKEGQYKISGNAQRRTRDFVLHHGTLLYDFDLTRIQRYLKMPIAVPEYRQGRAHDDFVRNVAVSSSLMKKALVSSVAPQQPFTAVSKRQQECLTEFLANKEVLVEINH